MGSAIGEILADHIQPCGQVFFRDVQRGRSQRFS
jgi:hypothetical protein